MRRFSITEAGFSGYRLLASKPGVALWWLAFSFLVGVISIAVLVWLAGPQMTALRQIQEAGPGAADPATMMDINRQMLRYTLFAYAFPWLTGAISIGAVARAIAGKGSSALGYLRFGADELRLLVTTLVTFLVIAVVFVVALFATVIAFGVSAGAGALSGGLSGLSPSALIAPGALLLLALVATVYLVIKLSLAPAQTVADKGIRIFSSWTLTKGHFWGILAAYLLALVPVLIGWSVDIAVLAAMNPQQAGAGGSLMHFMRSLQPDVSSMGAAFQPAYLATYFVSAVVRTLGMAALIAPGVVILQAVRQDVADTFGDDDDD